MPSDIIEPDVPSKSGCSGNSSKIAWSLARPLGVSAGAYLISQSLGSGFRVPITSAAVAPCSACAFDIIRTLDGSDFSLTMISMSPFLPGTAVAAAFLAAPTVSASSLALATSASRNALGSPWNSFIMSAMLSANDRVAGAGAGVGVATSTADSGTTLSEAFTTALTGIPSLLRNRKSMLS